MLLQGIRPSTWISPRRRCCTGRRRRRREQDGTGLVVVIVVGRFVRFVVRPRGHGSVHPRAEMAVGIDRVAAPPARAAARRRSTSSAWLAERGGLTAGDVQPHVAAIVDVFDRSRPPRRRRRPLRAGRAAGRWSGRSRARSGPSTNDRLDRLGRARARSASACRPAEAGRSAPCAGTRRSPPPAASRTSR